MATQKMFTVDRFKGVSEATDGYSELGQGFASRISNWNITDAGNISVRPGFSPVPYFADGAAIVAVYSAFIRNDEYLIAVTYDGSDTISVHRKEGTIFTLAAARTDLLGIRSETEVVKIFPFGDKVYIQSAENADHCRNTLCSYSSHRRSAYRWWNSAGKPKPAQLQTEDPVFRRRQRNDLCTAGGSHCPRRRRNRQRQPQCHL